MADEAPTTQPVPEAAVAKGGGDEAVAVAAGGEAAAAAGEAGEATKRNGIDESQLECGPQEEDLKVLDNLIHGALEALLIEAKERGIDKPPYGRGALCLPYDDYTKDEGSEEDDDEEYVEGDDEEGSEDFDEPPFKYEYGFNALRFVSDYLRAHNPNNPDMDFEETYEGDEDNDSDGAGEGEKTKDHPGAAAKLLS